MNNMNEQSRLDLTQSYNLFITKVYTWLFLGLLLTAGTSYGFYYYDLDFVLNPVIFITLTIGELFLVGIMSARVTKLNPSTTKILFISYSFINGITLSWIFELYAHASIIQTFLIASLTFGVMALFGHFTKTDLSGVGSFLYFAVFGILITMLVNMFMHSESIDLFISFAGLAVFWGLTAYDTQKLRSYFSYTHNNPALESNFALTGALTLYLDFINIFIFLLRILGRRK